LVGAAARTNLDVLLFLLKKETKWVQFELHKNVCQQGLNDWGNGVVERNRANWAFNWWCV
jgi:hypothetical protein